MMDKQYVVNRLVEIEKQIKTNRAVFSQHVDFMEKLNVEFHNLCGAQVECENMLKKENESVENISDC